MKAPVPPKPPGPFMIWLDENRTNIVLLVITIILLSNTVVIFQVKAEVQNTKYAVQTAAAMSLGANDSDSNWAGLYTPSLQLVRVLGLDRPIKEVLDTSIHEVGHYLDHQHVHTPNSKKYNHIFNTTDTFVTEYSKKNVKEDFAETFEEGMQYCFDMSKIPLDRQDFFRKKVLPHVPECEVS